MKKEKIRKPHKSVAIVMIAVLLTASLWAMQAAASMDVFYNISSYNNAFSDSNSSNNGLFSLSKFLPSVSKAANPTRHNEFEHYNDHVKIQRGLTSIYRYNTTSGLFEKCDHFDNWGWWPATGSESFTKLEPGRGYWVMAKNDCVWRHEA